MLDTNTIKALVEALLFANDRPITLKQIAAKVRSAARKLENAQGIAENNPESGVDLIANASDSNVDFADASEVDSNESEEITLSIENADLHEDSSAAEILVAEYEMSDDGEIASVENSEIVITAEAAEVANTESEVTEQTPAALAGVPVDEDEAARAQLLQRQKELEESVSMEEIKNALLAIEEELNGIDRGIELVQVARGYQLRTKYEVSRLLRDDKKAPPTRLSPSALETLAIVAYEQPATKHKIEEIRGVDCGGVLKTLLDRDLVRLVGRSDEPGRPLVYGTTNKFLEIFSLNSLKDLPNPGEFQDLASEADVDLSAETLEENLDGNEYIHVADFEDPDATTLSDAERAILEELDSSLSGLKNVEKGIELFDQKRAAKEASPEAVTVVDATPITVETTES